MPIVLITGAATGIGNLTARTLAAAGHTVYASMRDPAGKNSTNAQELLRTPGDVRIVELDVLSEDSARAAVATVVTEQGRLDVVVNNAGHLVHGYTEAFTPQELNHLLDVNVTGAHRVNRAALPQLRAQRSGLLLWVSSTIPVTTPPFLGPYVASKAAMDSLAVVTSYEANSFGIETVIVQPGPFTEGTAHFPNSSVASDDEVTAAYAELDGLVAGNHAATESLFSPGEDHHPQVVADEIARVLTLPVGDKPFRTVIDITHAGVAEANEVTTRLRRRFVERMRFTQLLHVAR